MNISLVNSVPSQIFTIALIDTWQWLGILLVAVLLQIDKIPRSYFQLADLEGLGWWNRWRRIVWPQIRVVLLLYTMFRLLDWLRKVDVIKAIFDRGYGGALQTLAMYVEQVRFQFASVEAGIQDPYGDFLALLQVMLLLAGVVYFSGSGRVNRLYKTARLEERGFEKAYVQPQKRRIAASIFWLLVLIFITVPFLWIGTLSVQTVDLSGAADFRFQFIPEHPTLEAYRSILSGNKEILNGSPEGILCGLEYSLRLCGTSAALAFIVAISAIFMFVADFRAERLRSSIMAFALSIFFFPPSTAVPALNKLTGWFPWFSSPSAQLSFFYTCNAFVLTFILMLIRCTTIPRSYFEQALLETHSRARAFFGAYLKHEPGVLFFVLVLAFSSCWSEFYITSFVTAAQDVKPFSVVLEMNYGQYNAYYSLFAAGACLSLASCVALPALTLLTLWLFSRVRAWLRRDRHASEQLAMRSS